MDPKKPAMPIRPVVSERVFFATGPFEFVAITIRDADGSEYDRAIVKHNGAVVVLPILETDDGPQIVLVRNERHAIGDWLDELPAGGIEPGEEPAAAAARELREETGYVAATLEYLGRFYTSPGMTNEVMDAYVATGLRHVGQDLDAGERLTVHPVPVGDLFDRMDAGLLRDGKSMLTLLLARSKGWLFGDTCQMTGRKPE